MEDTINTPKLPSWDYISGFFDGEGHISMYMSNGHPTMQIGITQKERHVLDLIQQVTGGSVRKHHNKAQNEMWVLDILGHETKLAFLNGISPFAIRRPTKRALAIYFLETSLSNEAKGFDGSKPTEANDRNTVLKFTIYDKFKELERGA